MKISNILVLLLVIALNNPVYADEIEFKNYVCNSEQASGFIYKNGKWQAAEFQNPENTYYLEFKGVLEEHEKIGAWKAAYIIKQNNEPYPMECIKKIDGIFCDKFVMTTQTMRYNKVYMGIINEDKETLKHMKFDLIKNPYIEIGSCAISSKETRLAK